MAIFPDNRALELYNEEHQKVAKMGKGDRHAGSVSRFSRRLVIRCLGDRTECGRDRVLFL